MKHKLIITILTLLMVNMSYANIVSIEKNSYSENETVDILINGPRDEINIEIRSPSNLYKYLGLPQPLLKFYPKSEGEYEIYVKDGNNRLLEIVRFIVSKILSRQNMGIAVFEVRNSNNEMLDASINIFNQEGQLLNTGNTFNPIIVTPSKYHVEINMSRKSISNIYFNNVTGLDFNLGYEELSNDQVDIFWKQTNKVYAIDPSRIQFDYATVSAIAEGYELYKCKDYNFTEKKCYGDFEKILDLTPGQEYSFILTPTDPLFTEQTSLTQECYCSNTCNTGPGATSQCTATCNDYCNINFTVPVGAISGWLEKVHYNINLNLTTSGTAVSGSHEGRLDKDETPNSANDVRIGLSTIATPGNNYVLMVNDNLDDSGTRSFDNIACTTWSNGYCTWKPYLYTSFVCQGSRKTCTTGISLVLINYTWNYTMDTTSPSLVINNPQNNSATSSPDNTFYYTPNDNLDLNNCSLYINTQLNQTNFSLVKGVQTTFSVSNMIDGLYSWYISCFDTAGNSNTSGIRYLTIDTVNPSIIYVYPTPINQSFLQNNFVTINVSHQDLNPDKLVLYWNNTPGIQSYSGSYTNITKTGLSDGQYIYYIRVNDTASNTNQTESVYITIDTINPTVQLQEPEHNFWINYNTIVFNYTPSDTNLQNCSLYGNFTASGQFELNQTAITPISGAKNSFQPITLADGIYVWNVLCHDKSGRQGWNSANFTIKIDSLPPVIMYLAPENNSFFNNSNLVEFNYSVTDNFDVVNNCTLMVISNATTNYYHDASVLTGVVQNFTEILANNKYNWTIYCTDPANNINTLQFYNLTIYVGEDVVGPSVTLNYPNNNNWTNIPLVPLVYTPSDQSLIFNCSLYINDHYNITYHNISNGEQNNFTLAFEDNIFTWYVSCTDNSTNKNTGVSPTWTFTVDTVPPETTLIFPVDHYNSSTNSINFTWYLRDEFSNNNYCDLVINSTAEATNILSLNNTNTNYTLYFSQEGAYFWNINCIDQAYNLNTSDTRFFSLDFTAPYVALVVPEDNNVSTFPDITFSYIPSDNTSGLQECSLYINGVLNETNYTLFNNQQNDFHLEIFSSGNYSWQVTCVDYFGNLGNATVYNLILDLDGPTVNSYSADPLTVDLLGSVEILANVTDNYYLDTVIVQITKPGGLAENFTLLSHQPDIYNLTYADTTERGTYSVIFISNDTYGNNNLSQEYYFFVRAGITIDKIYYDRGETVYIAGEGFDPQDNITLNITDPDNFVVDGFPTTIIANSTGGFLYSWEISTSSGIATGNYSILCYDTFSLGQNGKASAYLVRKPTFAVLVDKNNAGVIVSASVNESDSNYVLITTSATEDYLNLTWSNIVPAGQIISDIRFYIEHYEVDSYTLNVQWRNVSSNTWVDICGISASSVEKIDTCDLNDEVISSALANNLILRVGDKNNLGASIGDWTYIDFAYIEVYFTTLLVDKQEYQQGENVTITGSRWPHDSPLTINITRSDFTVDQVFTSSDANGDFTTTYQIPYDGSLGTYTFTVYVSTNPDDTNSLEFNVVKRNSSINTNKYFYSRTETVLISGIGFSSSGNISLMIYDSRNNLVENVIVSASEEFNGTLSYNWTIPMNYSGAYGRHMIYAVDQQYQNLNGTTYLNVGITTDNATRFENMVTSDVTHLVNQSDNISATLVTYDSVEDYIILHFYNTTSPVRILNNLTFYIEHNETQSFDLVLDWWNGTTWVYICTVPFSADETIHFCDLLPYIERSPRAQNLMLKITDNQSDIPIDGQLWTSIDYIYLTLNSEPDNVTPTLEIISPLPDSEFNYSESILLIVNVTENVQIDHVWANISWLDSSELVYFTAIDTNYYGEGIYATNFTGTYSLGLYNINFFVNDTSSNLNYSEHTNFTVSSPDLTSNGTYLSFSNDNPSENENITIYFTLFNIGTANSSAFFVKFYDGDYLSGIQINGDIYVPGLDAGHNITVNLSWITRIGTHNIQAVIDPPIDTNGTIREINESNNIVNREIFVPSYHIYYGNASLMIKLSKDTNESKFTWNSTTEGKIYVIETGAIIEWFSLHALGRTFINTSSTNDFHEADVSLGIENNSDSLNNTFLMEGLPIFEKNMTIFNMIVKDVPLINSTNTSVFMTGILWDTSDGNNEYNGSQDIIFVTEINRGQSGKFGIVDYEIRIPSTLDTHKLGTGTVSFYTEIV